MSEKEVKYFYIENVHNAPIICTGKDTTGKVLTKKFYHAMEDKWTGRQISTGFEKLNEEEYEFLCKYSKAFVHYKDNPKGTLAAPLLVLHEDIPPEAKAPHEALADARKESRGFKEEVRKLEAQLTQYKADLLDAQEKYRVLESASSDAEKLQPLQNEITELTGKNATLREFITTHLEILTALAAKSDLTAEDVQKLTATAGDAFKALSGTEDAQ